MAFTEGIILNILKSPTYIGKTFSDLQSFDNETGKKTITREYYKATWKGLVPEKTFNRVQKIIQKNTQTKGSEIAQNKHKFLLTGLIKCACCKSTMTPNFTIKPKKTYLYYQCTKVDKSDRNACKIRRVEAREIESLVLERVKYLASDKKTVEKIVQSAKKQTATNLPLLKSEQQRILARIRNIQSETENLFTTKNIKNLPSVQERIISLDKEKNQLEIERESIESQIAREKMNQLNPELIYENMTVFKDLFEMLTFEDKYNLLRIFIKQITYDAPPKPVKIQFYNLPEIEMPPNKPKKGSSGGIVASRFDKRQYWLPVYDCCKNFTYNFELEQVKKISQRALQHQKHLDSYVNPILKAREYETILKEQELTQGQLATKLGISRVRITQILNLLKLPQEQQDYIITHGKEKQITERGLRKFRYASPL